jgi:dimethylamine monooxygenase subunit A
MARLPYFPLTGDFNLRMGTSLLPANASIVESDDHYQAEIALKRKQLQEDYHYYYQSILPNQHAAWETVEKVLNDLVRHDPAHFALTLRGNELTFENKLLNEIQSFTPGIDSSLPVEPLDWVGRQVQEDLVLLNTPGEIVAGHLCFPSGWSLNEKMGRQFIEVHAPLPVLTAPMIQAANNLIERLPLNKPVVRNNWGFRLGNQLDLSSKHAMWYRKKLADENHGMNLTNIGEKIFLRVEHQTLTRLPKSGYVLFTIHTYQNVLAAEAAIPERKAGMYTFLKSTPKELIEYKQMEGFYDLLLEYLSV